MLRVRELSWRGTATFAAIWLVLLAVIVRLYSPMPVIDQRIGDATLHFSADRAWALYPGDCVMLGWQVEGIESIYVEGRGEIGFGEKPYCPAINDTAARFDARTPDGLTRERKLRIHFLPDVLLYTAAFAGFVGAIGLAAALLLDKQMRLNPRWLAVMLLALAVIGLALRLHPNEPLVMDYANDDIALRLWSKKGSLLFPRECLTAHWSVVGAESVAFNGEVDMPGREPGQGRYCVDFGGAPTLTITAADGVVSTHTLPVASNPIAEAGEAVFVAFQSLGLVMAGLVFLPQLWRALHDGWRARSWADLGAIGGCFGLVLLLYLPFGFQGAGHWEVWTNGAAIQGLHHIIHRGEEVSRFFAMTPHILSIALDSESFIGFNFVHALLHAGKLSLFYAILRQMGARPLHGFLCAALFFVYPVNSGLMSLRSLPLNHSMFWLLAGLCMTLAWLKTPRRRFLAGALFAMLFHSATHEAGYALVLTLPLLWWLRGGYDRRARLQATVIWYLSPAFKVAWLLLLELTHRPMYSQASAGGEADWLARALESLGWVYRQAFADGWAEAFASLADGTWLGWALIALAVVAAVAIWLTRRDAPLTSQRKIMAGMAGGLLAVLPAVGVLIWFAVYRNDDWRMFFYVPLGAAAAVFCLLLLLTSRLREKWRDWTLVALCLLLALPCLTRLYAQHARTIDAANRKTRILHDIVSLAPRPFPDTRLLVMTSLSWQEMEALGIWELAAGAMFEAAIWLTYGEHAPGAATFCLSPSHCSRIDSLDMLLIADDREAALQETLLLHLDADLTVSLVEDPVAYLGWDIESDYDASRLYDADAPLPPRAESMLSTGR